MNFISKYISNIKSAPSIIVVCFLMVLQINLKASNLGNKDSAFFASKLKYSSAQRTSDISRMSSSQLTIFIDQVFDLDSIPPTIIKAINLAVYAIENPPYHNIAKAPEPEAPKEKPKSEAYHKSDLAKELYDIEIDPEINRRLRKTNSFVADISSAIPKINNIYFSSVPSTVKEVEKVLLMEYINIQKQYLNREAGTVGEIGSLSTTNKYSIVHLVTTEKVLITPIPETAGQLDANIKNGYHYYNSKNLHYYAPKNQLIIEDKLTSNESIELVKIATLPPPINIIERVSKIYLSPPTGLLVADKQLSTENLMSNLKRKSIELIATKKRLVPEYTNTNGLSTENIMSKLESKTVELIAAKKRFIPEHSNTFKFIYQFNQINITPHKVELIKMADRTIENNEDYFTFQPIKYSNTETQRIIYLNKNTLKGITSITKEISDSFSNKMLSDKCHETICKSKAEDIIINSAITEKPSSNYYLTWETSKLFPVEDRLILKNDTTISLTVLGNGHCKYTHPFNGTITSKFGWRDSSMHSGIDIDLVRGDKVAAAFDGMVRISKNAGGYGRVVVIRHYNGLETVYAHLSKSLVKPGQIVYSGDIIGLGGNTGHSTGSHLHFELRFKGVAINPKYLIALSDQVLISDEFTLKKTKYGLAVYPKDRKSYTVVRGDTVFEIAKRFGMTTRSIKDLNHLSSTWARLRTGMQINVTQ